MLWHWHCVTMPSQMPTVLSTVQKLTGPAMNWFPNMFTHVNFILPSMSMKKSSFYFEWQPGNMYNYYMYINTAETLLACMNSSVHIQSALYCMYCMSTFIIIYLLLLDGILDNAIIQSQWVWTYSMGLKMPQAQMPTVGHKKIGVVTLQ